MGYNDRLEALEKMMAQMKDVIEGLTENDVPWECETREERAERKEREKEERRKKDNEKGGGRSWECSHRPDGWDGFRSKGDNDDNHGHPRW